MGEGSVRERRPGVWEVRVAVGADPVTGRTLQRSFCFHGDAAAVDAYRCELAAAYAEQGGVRTVAPFITVGDLSERWMAVEHWWMPWTIVGYRSTVKALVASPLADVRVLSLSPQQLRTVLSAWQRQGDSVSTVGARYRVVRSALVWAFEERIIDRNPLEGMRGGPPRPEPRRDIPFEDVRRLLSR